MAESSSGGDDSMWRYWPCFLGGLCSPLLAHALVKWFSPPFAMGIGLFVMWVVVGLIFSLAPPNPKWSLVRWVGGGVVGGLVAGVVAFFVHSM